MADNDSDISKREPFVVAFSTNDDKNSARYRMNVRNPKWSVPEYCKEIWISGSMDPDDLKYRRLLDLFLNCERKWNCIHLECQYAVSPTALLTLLEATFNKTNMLHLNNCMLDVPSFSSLYDGMASRNELRRITLEHSGPFLEEQMAIFAEGLSLAKDLEFLSLRNINLQSSRITEALIAGLQDNDTLECLNLSFCRIQRDTLPRLLASLYNHSKLTRLEIFTSNRLSPIIHDHIRDWLSRHDCKLECLALREQYDVTSREYARVQYRSETVLDLTALSEIRIVNLEGPNRSLKDLQLQRMAIESPLLEGRLSRFENLISLDLSLNQIGDLQPLDCLLIGDNCTLETLILADNPISLPDTLRFARKLPQMKALRNLEFPGRSLFCDIMGACKEFTEYVAQNTSLERVETEFSAGGASLSHPKVAYATSMNRAARKYFRQNQTEPPLELFPNILARVTNIRYYNGNRRRSVWGKPEDAWDGFDAILWLLRGNSTFLSGTGLQT